jgi:1-acyl-sn-glycerol-3-phosphate acyltransferase
MPEAKKSNPYDSFHVFMHHCIMNLLLVPFYYLFYKFKVVGKENVPKGAFVLASNHYSYGDPTTIAIAVKRAIAYIAKKELFDDDSLLTKTITFLGAIPINREKPGTSTLKTVKEAAKAGWAIGIFVEGTRNKSREVFSKLETGAAFIAKLGGGLPVVPVGIRGGEKLFSSLEVHVGKPIVFDKTKSLEEMTLQYGQEVARLAGLRFELNQANILAATSNPAK